MSSRDDKFDDMQRYLMVIRTFCQLEASEPVDTQRLMSSSAPLSSRDGEPDDMQRYLMVIRAFCQPEASEPVDTRRFTSSSALTRSIILTFESR